jgi:hypothetical protein
MDQCIICIEEGDLLLLKHKSHCDCEYHVHHKCLKKWIEQNNKCIICRESYLLEDVVDCRSLMCTVLLFNVLFIGFIWVLMWHL